MHKTFDSYILAIALACISALFGIGASAQTSPFRITRVTVSISPVSATLPTGGTQQFSATITGTADTAVTWSTTGGTISIDGLYTAPASAGVYNVTATSQADTTKSASAVITVTVPSAQPIAFVQVAAATPQSPQSTLKVVYPAAQTAGDLNVVVVGWNDGTSNVTSVSDSSGNAYILAVGPTTTTGLSQSIYYAKDIASGRNTVTVTFNRAAGNPDIRILEYAGLDTVSPLDVTATAAGNSSSASSGPATTTAASELILGADTIATTTTGVESGFTSRIITSPDSDLVEDKIVSATGSYSATASLSSGSWVMQMATFKAAATATSPAVAVSVTPSSTNLVTGATQQFTATVTGATNTAVTWSASCGTITASGFYTAPAAAGSCTVTATSQADTTKSASAVVTVASSSLGSPVLVQHVSSSSTRNNSISSPYCYTYQLPGFTTAGNAVVAGFTFSGGPTPSVTDDKGDTYTIAETYLDGTDGVSVGIAAAFNVAAEARVISLCFSSNPGTFVQPMASEFNNVIGIDGPGTGNHGTGTSVTAGGMAPTMSGDLVYQVVASLSRNQSSFTAGTQGNITWNLLSADLMDGWAGQYGVYNSTSAVNPALTLGTSQKWVSGAILLKTGTSGGVLSGLRIVRLIHENIPVNTSAGGTGNSFANPTSLQFPSSGNLLVAMIGGGIACRVTSITDTNQNTWTQAGANQIQAGGNDTVGAYYAGNAIPGNLALTVHWSASDGDQTIFLYDVTGAASSPLDTTAGSSGSQSVAGNLTTPFTITPAEANEIIFEEVIWDYNTGSGLVGQGQFFDTNTFDGESQSGPEPVDQNNGWGHAITTSTNPVGITWETMYSGLATGNWAGMAAAFKPAP